MSWKISAYRISTNIVHYSNILQNNFYDQQKKEMHSGLKQLEGEYNNDTIFIFGWTINLMLIK